MIKYVMANIHKHTNNLLAEHILFRPLYLSRIILFTSLKFVDVQPLKYSFPTLIGVVQ